MHINFNAHITSRNHYTVSFANNIINNINALGIFNLCDYSYISSAVISQKSFNFSYIIGSSYEWRRNKINVLLDTEKNIVNIFLAHIRHWKCDIWDVNTFFIWNNSAVFNLTKNFAILYADNFHLNKTVVNKNFTSHLNVIRKICISDRNLIFVTHNVICAQSELLTFFKFNLAFLKVLYTNFWAFCVK